MPYGIIDSNLLSYIGGIIDGEGSIAFCKTNRSRKTNKHPNYTVRISVSMCDKEIPELLKNTFGGAIYKKPESNGHKICYDWVISAKNCKEFLEIILPYLRVLRKIETAKLCLEVQNKISDKNIKFKKITEDEILYRESIYLRCKELNHRGVN